MSISDPSDYYRCLQPDNIVAEAGWNLRLAAPIRAFEDVIAVSAMCAHSFDFAFDRVLGSRLEAHNLSAKADHAGPCCCANGALPSGRMYAAAIEGSSSGRSSAGGVRSRS